MDIKSLLSLVLALCVGVTLPALPPLSDGDLPKAATVLEDAYQLSANLNHPDDRAAVLTLLVGAAASVPPERTAAWAVDLFNVAKFTSFPDSAQESAMTTLAKVDTERAVQLFREQVVPPEDANEDSRTFAAVVLFQTLWAQKGKDSILTIENLAAWLGSTGEYPYSAVGTVITELAKTDPLLSRSFFLEAVRHFKLERKFPDSNRAYVDFLVALRGLPHDDVFRSSVATAVDAIENASLSSGQKSIQVKIQTTKSTQVFYSEKEYLLYKLLPLIREMDPKWYERILESSPSLRGRPDLAGDEGVRFESGVVAQTNDPATIGEAFDSNQLRRAVQLSRTDPKAAFSVADAISTPHMRDIALASILPRYTEVDQDQATSTLNELQKHLETMHASPAKLALEVKLTDALFGLNLRSEAILLSHKAMDLGVELFSLDRLSHPGKRPVEAQGFQSMLDLAGILGRRLRSTVAEQQIMQVRDEALKLCMLAIFGRGLGEAEHQTSSPH